MLVQFNRHPVKLGRTIEQPSTELVKNTIALWNADLEDAVRYGGDLTRAAIGAMNLRGDRKYTVVDTKVHMLVPGFYPSIPGWHTDGVPRGHSGGPADKQPPHMLRQVYGDMVPPRYHLLVTGHGCLTEFISEGVALRVPDQPSTDLYKHMSHDINALLADGQVTKFEAPSCQVVEWDWWNIHQGRQATKHEWRFLIRVTETDHIEPKKDLRDILRVQQQVYAPAEFGW